jgi:hypothetical protein
MLAAGLVATCGVPDVARYQAILDELAVPPTWDLALSKVITPDTEPNCGGLFGDCPRAFLYYLVDAETGADAYAEAKAMITTAGFEVDQEIRPTCDADPPRTPACGMSASKDSDFLQVSLFNPGEDPDNVGVADPNRMQVRLIAKPK